MTTQNAGLHSIRERLERLERQNRWFMRAGLAAVLLAAAVVVMGQARPSRTVTANRFVLQDSEDRTRAVLQTDSTRTTLIFLDSMGRKRMILSGGTGPTENAYAYLQLGEAAAHERYVLDSTGGEVTLSTGGLVMGAYPPGKKAGSVLLEAPGSGNPHLEITDSQGYSAQLGVTGIVYPRTGDIHTTSAASLVLLSKDRKVLWSAP